MAANQLGADLSQLPGAVPVDYSENRKLCHAQRIHLLEVSCKMLQSRIVHTAHYKDLANKCLLTLARQLFDRHKQPVPIIELIPMI